MDDMYKNQIDYAEIPADAVILDVRNGSEHTEIALRRKHYSGFRSIRLFWRWRWRREGEVWRSV